MEGEAGVGEVGEVIEDGLEWRESRLGLVASGCDGGGL